MWNKREEPPKPYHPTPTPVAPSPVEPQKEAAFVSSTPVGRFEQDNRAGTASIGKAVKVVGQIFSKEDLYVDGDLEGTLEALEHKVTVGPHGTVHAGVKARDIVVLGLIQGNVEATEKIDIRKDAKLIGDIKTARIVIEDGAFFKGSIDIVKPDPARVAAKSPQHAAPAGVSQNSVPGAAPEPKVNHKT
jgi:cytoskeletal protein CcmA (bactofilin family)